MPVGMHHMLLQGLARWVAIDNNLSEEVRALSLNA
jgi:hypothetical protein